MLPATRIAIRSGRRGRSTIKRDLLLPPVLSGAGRAVTPEISKSARSIEPPHNRRSMAGEGVPRLAVNHPFGDNVRRWTFQRYLADAAVHDFDVGYPIDFRSRQLQGRTNQKACALVNGHAAVGRGRTSKGKAVPSTATMSPRMGAESHQAEATVHPALA